MNYRLRLSRDTADMLARQPERLRLAIGDHLLDLAERPATLSRPSRTPPHPAGFQAIRSTWSMRRTHWFIVLFRYGADEETRHTHGIGHVRYENS